MKIILHADLPLKGKPDGEVKGRIEEPYTSLDNNLTRQVDEGYRAFWQRRGMEPPKVATTFVEAVYQQPGIEL